MGQISTAILTFLGLVAFANYRNGTLPDWLKAKFLNAADPSPSSSPFEPVSTSPAGAVGPVEQTGLGAGLGKLLAPVKGAISGLFGEDRPGHKHAGIDYSAPMGTPIAAARGGVVTYAGASGNYGLRVDIDHGGGVITRYAHLSRLGVDLGQEVRQGAEIGKVGSTGRSTGPHLHFELRRNGEAIDPSSYLGQVFA